MNYLIAVIAGTLFGSGLLLSGMMDPSKVIGFLDVFGNWDPSLIFVMGSALVVTIPTFYLVLKRNKPVLTERFNLPLKHTIDKPLILGAIIFGVGWGLVGYCPGPAISSLAGGSTTSIIFVLSMVAGMFAADKVKLSN